ncbi:2-hydroxyacid dehydrogenase [Paraglaciecola sp.]|uniref:2-hydroxyacid dehydrogenase n=1 Tax=Paraglaciecola sp. TaxID=1920173 RepID=UPI0030F39303
MKIAFFNTKSYDQRYFDSANQEHGHELHYIPSHLNSETAHLIKDEEVVCAFINDSLNAEVLTTLKSKDVKLIALRSAGFNHVDLVAAKNLDLPVVRVPTYSPYAVAEHAVGLLLCLNRKIHRAFNRVREGDFSLHNLMGFDMHGKTIGVIGTGKIGQTFIKIMLGFGCKVIAYDICVNEECQKKGVEYVSLETLFAQANVISLHCPLNEATHHLINQDSLNLMQDGVTIINTSRGKLIDTKAVIQALKRGKVGLLGLDVYEEEEALFFEDFSDSVIQDDQLSRLLTFPNVIVTSHQAFFTEEAMQKIAGVTLNNITEFATHGVIQNQVTVN